MKICVDCGRQLFDKDNSCDKCYGKNIISEEEYTKIVEEIKHTNIFAKKRLLQNHDYKCIYDRLQEPEKSSSKPIILGNSNYESDEEYWERINQHTINNSISTNTIIECPYCHSTNTKKIHYFSWLGMVGKQFHCNNCNANF